MWWHIADAKYNTRHHTTLFDAHTHKVHGVWLMMRTGARFQVVYIHTNRYTCAVALRRRLHHRRPVPTLHSHHSSTRVAGKLLYVDYQ